MPNGLRLGSLGEGVVYYSYGNGVNYCGQRVDCVTLYYLKIATSIFLILLALIQGELAIPHQKVS